MFLARARAQAFDAQPVGFAHRFAAALPHVRPVNDTPRLWVGQPVAASGSAPIGGWSL